MSLTKRMKYIAGTIVAGTAIGAASMVGLAGTANADQPAPNKFMLCNEGKGHSVYAKFNGFTTFIRYRGDACTTVNVRPAAQFQLVFNMPNGQEKRTAKIPTDWNGNTKVVTLPGAHYDISKY